MAKRSNENVGEIGKSKIRFIYAEVEGSDQSLQSLMGTMAAAMSRPATAIHHRSLTGGGPKLFRRAVGHRKRIQPKIRQKKRTIGERHRNLDLTLTQPLARALRKKGHGETAKRLIGTPASQSCQILI